MKPLVIIGILGVFVLGTYEGYRRWTGRSSEAAAEISATEGPATAPALAKPPEAVAASADGALAPGQVPGPRVATPFTPKTVAGQSKTSGFPGYTDGRFDLGDNVPPPVGADGRANPDPFPEPPRGTGPETDAFSDLPPPPPPRVAEDYDGTSPSFPDDPAFADPDTF